MRLKRAFFALVCCLVCFQAVSAPQKKSGDRDSLVCLLNAKYAELMEIEGMQYRKVMGPATFLHNNAYLLCDSALWNINTRIIEAFGHVQIIQNKNFLTSDSLVYLIDRDLAKFRGRIVELVDDEKNTLRSDNMDYNTKDSVATFVGGGALKDKDGNVIEGYRGKFDSKSGIFSFERNVEMFNDSLFIKTDKLDYDSNEGIAWFGNPTYMWRNDGFLRADGGWYKNDSAIAYFNRDVYMNSRDYEAWCDEVYYFRQQDSTEMYHNVQILDTLHQTFFLSHKAEASSDSISNIHVLFTNSPAMIYYGENENHVTDSLFMAADSLYFFSRRMCDIAPEEFTEAEQRKKDILFDAIAEADKKAEEKRLQEQKEAEDKKPENIARKKREEIAAKAAEDSLKALGIDPASSLLLNDSTAAKIDSTSIAADSTTADVGFTDAEADSIAAQLDPAASAPIDSSAAVGAAPIDSSATVAVAAPIDSSAAAQLDTTQLHFLEAYRNARFYRTDMQGRCDSLAFSEIDSVAKLYTNPVLWNEGKNQLTSDLMMLYIKDNALHRGNMLDNAMIISMEDSLHYDQIKSTEMSGFFKDNQLYRFDALGGVNAILYLREHDVITTANIKEARTLTVKLKDGTAERMKYLEQIKSDAHPVAGLEANKQKLKGFKWRGDERPVTRFEITDRKVVSSQRNDFGHIQMPFFLITNKYFSDYMKSVYKEISDRAEAKRLEQARQDSIRVATECNNLIIADSLICVERDTTIELLNRALALKLELSDSLGNSATQEAVELQPAVQQERKAMLDSVNIIVSNFTSKLDSLEDIMLDNSRCADSLGFNLMRNGKIVKYEIEKQRVNRIIQSVATEQNSDQEAKQGSDKVTGLNDRVGLQLLDSVKNDSLLTLHSSRKDSIMSSRRYMRDSLDVGSDEMISDLKNAILEASEENIAAGDNVVDKGNIIEQKKLTCREKHIIRKAERMKRRALRKEERLKKRLARHAKQNLEIVEVG